MPDATALGADLYEMYRVGRKVLPDAAVQYSVANRALDATQDGTSALFLQPTCFNGDIYSPVFPAWRELRDELQRVLAETQTNLELTGDVLCMAADAYARTDEAAARALQEAKNLKGDWPPVHVPAPIYPPARTGQGG